MLDAFPIIGFIPVTDPVRARSFYVDQLGLEFVADDGFAIVLRGHGNMIRLVRTGEFTPVQYTILGWEVPELGPAITALTQAGVSFSRYAWAKQDELGIWTAPNGNQVAWFQDPDGNVLSLSSH
jgi:catechol 2,3-dioxygenase-like lactoylglutathione lyase family enzyme